MPEPFRVFISYSHTDEKLKDKLVEQLMVLERFHNVAVWTDDAIEPGATWEVEIEKAMAATNVALLLVSAAFLASNFINRKEVPAFLKRHARGGLRVIPVILRPCPWQHHPALKSFKALPKDAVPITKHTGYRRASAYKDVAEAIAKLAGHRAPKGLPSRAKKKWIQIIINRDLEDKPETDLALENAQLRLAVNLGIPLDQIEIKRVQKGSIKVTIALPEPAADRLVEGFRRRESPLHKDLEKIGIVDVRPTSGWHFGREIRRRRESLGMTLEQCAERANLTPNYIGTIENGVRDPSLSTVLALARGLRVPPAELFGGIPSLSPAATEAGLLFDAAPPDVQDAVLQLLRSIARKSAVREPEARIRETG
jgi:transcriptional regulator with XRE-family HTH domain